MFQLGHLIYAVEFRSLRACLQSSLEDVYLRCPALIIILVSCLWTLLPDIAESSSNSPSFRWMVCSSCLDLSFSSTGCFLVMTNFFPAFRTLSCGCLPDAGRYMSSISRDSHFSIPSGKVLHQIRSLHFYRPSNHLSVLDVENSLRISYLSSSCIRPCRTFCRSP